MKFLNIPKFKCFLESNEILEHLIKSIKNVPQRLPNWYLITELRPIN